jgi:hypothetical protein
MNATILGVVTILRLFDNEIPPSRGVMYKFHIGRSSIFLYSLRVRYRGAYDAWRIYDLQGSRGVQAGGEDDRLTAEEKISGFKVGGRWWFRDVIENSIDQQTEYRQKWPDFHECARRDRPKGQAAQASDWINL